MQKNILFYFVAFALLTTVFWFFSRAYQGLIYYTELTKHHNTVYACFQNLSKEINNAAISNPSLANATNSLRIRGLFLADSISVMQQVNLLKSTVRDSVNINIADELDTRIKSEVSWLVKSNVPDSIILHRSTGHIASLYSIDSLIRQGTQRASLLIEIENKQLGEIIRKIILLMMAFVILSGALLIYSTLNFFTQRTKTLGAEKELEKSFSEKEQAEERIRQSELRFRSLIENGYDIVSISDENFRPFYRSPSSVRITGWTNEDRDKDSTGAVGETHPDDLSRLRDTMKAVLSNPEVSFSVSFRTRHKDGHYIFLEGLIVNMLHHDAIKGVVSNFRDVTETWKAEEKLKESEKIYKTIASSIPGSVICLIDKDYRYLLIEGDMLESLGYSKEKLLGNKMEDVIPPERFAEVLPQLHRVFNRESFTVENARVGFDTLSRFVPLKDETNHVVAAMIVLFDVSELKKAQRSIVELNIGLEHKIKERTAELQLVNKELEAFTYSVAHDLRAPLRSINGYATMLLEDYCEKFDQGGKRMIDAVANNAKRMGMLIDDLLAFSKLGKQEIRKSLVNMKQIAESSIVDIHLAEGYPGTIKINNLHAVNADHSLMKHVMINLLSNAVKYSSKKEKPVIEISSWEENEMIIHSVADNGVGFDMAYADKLFGVFQRLHSDQEFEGTGVGLAIVQRIIDRHGGKIWAESQVNQGATFYFSLPDTHQN